MEKDRGLYGISVVTELTGATQQGLRDLEARGLISPARTEGGTRRYSQNDVERINEIVALLGTGVNHQGVAQLIELQAEVQRLRNTIRSLSTASRGGDGRDD